MQQIGRKIYFDKLTGNVLVDTGERAGFVRETTQEEDFQAYAALAERVPATVGCLQLEYAQDSDKFSQYQYRIDPQSQKIIWDLTPPTASIDQVKAAKIDLLNKECFKMIFAGFKSVSTGYIFRFNEEDQANFNQQSTLFLLKPELTETQWKTENAGIITLTREKFIKVVYEASQHKQQQINKYWKLKEQIEAATTKEEVDRINW